MENNNCHFQVGSLVTANLSWHLALPISIGANFGHNPYSFRAYLQSNALRVIVMQLVPVSSELGWIGWCTSR